MSMIGDPITASLNELRFLIPPQILKKVFITKTQCWRSQNVSLNERIMEEVIRPRVLQDCNIAYGMEVFIDLSSLPAEEVGPYSTVYRIPKELTQGRSILSALNVIYGTVHTGNGGTIAAGMIGSSGSALQQGISALMDNHATSPMTSTAQVQLVGENVILIRDTIKQVGSCQLRCVLENDERMTHLHYKAIPVLKKLVGYAVKSYIYNTYLIEMDQAELSGGQELGTFKDVISNYADAEELYQTTLKEEYARAAVSTDQVTMQRYIKSMIGGLR